MSIEYTEEESLVRQRMAEEAKVQEKTDGESNRWTKVYFGGGAHLENWLSQFIEIKGAENVEAEEIDSSGFMCYEGSGEKMYRIWVRENIER